MVEGTRALPPADLLGRLCALVREERRDDALVTFFTEAVGLPPATVDAMRGAPTWGRMRALAHTLPYDAAIHGDYRLPSDRLARLSVPTLAIDGSESQPWIRATAQAVADAIPVAQHLTLADEDHSVLQRPAVLRQPLLDFLT
jgi:pimeloyl-ACP methyl ester carboxylesterase